MEVEGIHVPSADTEKGVAIHRRVDRPSHAPRQTDDDSDSDPDRPRTVGSLTLTPAEFRMAIYLVTNEFFLEFVRARGYEKDAYWIGVAPEARAKFRCQDGQSIGPSTWPTNEGCLPGRERHPVAGIGYYEALAFCRWLQEIHQPEAGWRWRVPTEDMWEFTARTEKGLRYPWGNEFKSGACNSVETGNRTTTDVNTFPEGKTKHGCFDMAGNVWELVVADDAQDWSCVLRGGSYRNNRHEVRSYLRLFSVPRDHRPPDFGSGVPKSRTGCE
jgi:formylglycine-generating enzyme required for sulfatase activity